MRNILLLFFVLAAISGFAFSSDLMDYPPPLEVGDILADFCVGYVFASGLGATLKFPPVVASVERCLPSFPVSIGILAGFYQFELKSALYDWVETWTYATICAKANWHWDIAINWLDLYTGAFIGYPSYGGFEFGGQLGAHFYFAKHIGAVLEFGFPFIAKAGLALKF